MSRFNRTLGLAVVACLAWSGMGRGADVRAFLPKETDVVITANVRQMLDSELVKKYALDMIKDALSSNKDAQQALNALGLDPMKDFDRVTIGASLEDVSNPKAVVVAQGRFDVRKMNDLMDKLAKDDPKKFAVEQASGKTVYKITSPDQPTPMYAAPVDASTVVLATTKESVVSAFAAVSGTGAPAVRKEVTDLLDKADKNASLSIVAYTKGRLDALPLPDPEMKKVLEQVQSLSINVKVTQDVGLDISVGTPDDASAKKMREMVAGGLELAKVQVKVAVAQQAELQPLVDLVNSMTADAKDKSVVITGKVSGSAIEKAVGNKK